MILIPFAFCDEKVLIVENTAINTLTFIFFNIIFQITMEQNIQISLTINIKVYKRYIIKEVLLSLPNC